MDAKQGVIIVDHGSRRAESNEQLRVVAELVREQLPSEVPVAVAHMEIAQPDIGSAVASLVERGVRHIVVAPYFLSPGRHAEVDIPRLADEAVARHPGVTVQVGACLGPDLTLARLLVQRAIAAGLQL